MGRRGRDRDDLHGFLNVCKAAGFTSHDVVAIARRTLGTRRIGHAGTLDPAAEGVLPLAVGRATRLVDRLADGDKGYYGEIVLGERTTTDDAEGEVVEARPLPDGMDEAALDRALDAFRGPILQVPPRFSAIKVAGRRAYEVARRGGDVELGARPVTVHRLTLHWYRAPRLGVTIACSKGTYIRAIARDLGDALGCGAHLAKLVRLWVGGLTLADALSLDEIGERVRAGRVHEALLPADHAILNLPAAVVDPSRRADMLHGRAWRRARGAAFPPAPGGSGGSSLPVPPMPGGPVALQECGVGGTTGHGGDGRAPAAEPEGAEEMTSPEPLARVYDTGGALLGLAAADARRGLWLPRLAILREAPAAE